MTSKEIQSTPAVDKNERAWLKEIAYQLALINEKPTPQTAQAPVIQPTAKQAYKHGNRS